MSGKKWAVGVTTVIERMRNNLLDTTLVSLERAGFPKPRLFIDGSEGLSEFDVLISTYDVTIRSPKILTAGNWTLAAWELLYRHPDSDLFAIFQDDCIAVRNLRQYIEAINYPSNGYLNLYTFPKNEKPIKGFYLSNQLGLGAVGLVFSNKALRVCLGSQHMANRPIAKRIRKGKEQPSPRRWKAIDGGIVETIKKAGWKEYVHNPSLIQHTGKQSAMGNRMQPQAGTFPGEEFDALSLLENVRAVQHIPDQKSIKIGLVGYNCANGIGEINRQIIEHIDVKSWLMIPHRINGVLDSPKNIEAIVYKEQRHIDMFLKNIDVVLFVETPFFEGIVNRAKELGKRVVCVPMWEWLPPDATGWTSKVDLFICPTMQSYNEVQRYGSRVQFPWPFDIERFKFQQRDKCERFLFINGHGGWGGRKGFSTIEEAMKLWPEFPVSIRSQKPLNGLNVLPACESNADLYAEGDILIMPHSIDGLGLELLEAMACGMPVIATDGWPWNEHPTIKIKSKLGKRKIRSMVDWYTPDANHLVETCKKLLGQNIDDLSRDMRRYAEQNRWQTRVGEFTNLVKTGINDKFVLPFDITGAKS